MHGFLWILSCIGASVVDPDAYDKFLKSKTEDRIKEQRSGIKVKSKLPEVNKPYANYLLNNKGMKRIRS